MRAFKIVSKTNTLYKYFCSYFALLLILTAGYSAAFHFQFEDIYTKELHTQVDKQLENIQTNLESAFITLNKIQYLLEQDIDLTMSRYTNETWNLYQSSKKISEYSSANDFIEAICYLNPDKEQFLSSRNHFRKADNGYEIYCDNHYISFPMKSFLESYKHNQLVFLQDGTSKLLIYLPYMDERKHYNIFYILRLPEIQNMLNCGIGSAIASIGLLDQNNVLVTGYDPEILEPYLDEFKPPYQPSDDLHFTDKILNGFSLIAVLSGDVILSQVNAALRNVYVILAGLSLVGMLLILCGMRLTYWPLYKLIKRLSPQVPWQSNLVNQIDTAFSNMCSEKEQLQNKVDSYRLSIQKSLLDSIVENKVIIRENDSDMIDHLFCMEPDSLIFMVKIKTNVKSKNFPQDILDLFNVSLPGEPKPALLFEYSKSYAVFLICYTGEEPNKDEVLHQLLTDLYQEAGYLSAMSNSASSPLEIPSLYENADAASKFWDRIPIAVYSEISEQLPSAGNFHYPYSHLEILADAIKACQITKAREQLLELFKLLNAAAAADFAFPDFFIRCVLIDILTVLLNGMNNINTKFKSYNDLYFNTLFLSRSCSYSEKKEEIQSNILSLLHIYETEYQNSTVPIPRIQEMIEKEYTSPDFSIAALADGFHVSTAYISFLFKKNFGVNFSDYLWTLRLKKAQELLLQTDLSIDQISVHVGYLNTSSFRRKFKQETGVTPSQYRTSKNP